MSGIGKRDLNPGWPLFKSTLGAKKMSVDQNAVVCARSIFLRSARLSLLVEGRSVEALLDARSMSRMTSCDQAPPGAAENILNYP